MNELYRPFELGSTQRRALRIGLVLGALLALLALTATRAKAAPPDNTYDNAMTFIGDSVTAGFGFCGTAENAKNVNCSANQEMSDRWYFGDNSLADCAPPDAPALPNDACSNNNYNGNPWKQAPWTAGPGAPTIAYPFQIAAQQTGPEPAAVSDWAVTGSTPANWDPDGGEFGFLTDKIRNQYVGMTLGANPLLAYYTNIELGLKSVSGPCVSSTGFEVPGWFFFTGTAYANPLAVTLACAERNWDNLRQGQHLVSIYKSLLAHGNRVVVMGYYRDCSWSFGNWQPNANPSGPASGKDCKDQKRETSPDNPKIITQWDQAVAVGNKLNDLIRASVDEAKDQARKQWPGSGRDDNIVFVEPDPTEWEQHQPKSPRGSWVLLRDTWIHPNRAGAANLADTVTGAMCSRFDHWCGAPISWNRR